MDVLCGKADGSFGENPAQDGRPSGDPGPLETFFMLLLLPLILPGYEQLAALLWIIVPGPLRSGFPV